MKKVEFNKSQTLKNLARSFASECMEGAKYQFVAKLCEGEDLAYLKSVFKTLAKHEMSHAKVFWDEMHANYNGEIIDNVELSFGYPFDCDDLCQSLMCHAQSEAKLYDSIYPEFAKTAKAEGYAEIAHKFELIATVENCHSHLLTQIHEKMVAGKLYKSKQSQKWKCNQCGFEHTAKEPPAVCPLCEYEQGYYEIPFDMGK